MVPLGPILSRVKTHNDTHMSRLMGACNLGEDPTVYVVAEKEMLPAMRQRQYQSSSEVPHCTLHCQPASVSAVFVELALWETSTIVKYGRNAAPVFVSPTGKNIEGLPVATCHL